MCRAKSPPTCSCLSCCAENRKALFSKYMQNVISMFCALRWHMNVFSQKAIGVCPVSSRLLKEHQLIKTITPLRLNMHMNVTLLLVHFLTHFNLCVISSVFLQNTNSSWSTDTRACEQKKKKKNLYQWSTSHQLCARVSIFGIRELMRNVMLSMQWLFQSGVVKVHAGEYIAHFVCALSRHKHTHWADIAQV